MDEATEYLEIRTAGGTDLRPLAVSPVTIGSAGDNHIVLQDDPLISRHHAALELVGPTWIIRDLGSTNGTFVEGKRLWNDQPLRPGHELQLGQTRMVFRSERGPQHSSTTETGQVPIVITPRERDILLALCRPLVQPDFFTVPASIREIAKALFVTDAAVKQHLVHLYDKFEIHSPGDEGRRIRLANEVMRRGILTMADLRASAGPRS
jgi:hypothetical protein